MIPEIVRFPGDLVGRKYPEVDLKTSHVQNRAFGFTESDPALQLCVKHMGKKSNAFFKITADKMDVMKFKDGHFTKYLC